MSGLNFNSTTSLPSVKSPHDWDVVEVNQLPSVIPDATIVNILTTIAMAVEATLSFGEVCSLFGKSRGVSKLIGDSSVLLISIPTGLTIRNLDLDQIGTGDMIELDPSNPFDELVIEDSILRGIVRVKKGISLTIRNTRIAGTGGQIIVDTTADLANLVIKDVSTMEGTAANHQVIIIQSGAHVGRISIDDGAFTLIQPLTVGIYVEDGAVIDDWNILSSSINVIDSSSIGIVFENIKNAEGLIANNTITGAGVPFSTNPKNPTTFAAPDGVMQDIAISVAGNLYSIGSSNKTIYKHNGISATIDDDLAIAGNPSAITVIQENPIVCNFGLGIRMYDKMTLTVLATFTHVGSNPVGATTVNGDLVVLDATDVVIYRYAGISSTQRADSPIDISSLVVSGAWSSIENTGVNFALLDSDGYVTITKGHTGEKLYRVFLSDVPSTQNKGLATLRSDNSFVVVSNTDDTNYYYTAPVEWDHSSHSWLFNNNTNLLASTVRGGAFFQTDTPITIPLVQNVYTDVSDGGVDLIYRHEAAMERLFISDQNTGQATFVGEIPQEVTIKATITAQRTGSAQPTFFSVAILIQNLFQSDSVDTFPIPDSSSFAKLETKSLKITLNPFDTIDFQVSNNTDANSLEVYGAALLFT